LKLNIPQKVKLSHILSASDTEEVSEVGTIETKLPKSLEIESVINEYNDLITYEIHGSGTVGAAVAVVYKDEIAFLKCFGVKKAGEDDPIDENTVFRLASVSKTITGVLAGILDNKKIISLDDKVVDYIPGFRLKSLYNTKNLTIRNLLSHTTGLTPHAYDNMVEEKVPLCRIMEVLNHANVSSAPGTLYSYQNVMFGMFDTLVNARTTKKYADLVKEEIFIPFGMKDASTDFISFKNNLNKAFPHTGAQGNYRCVRLNDRYYTTAPAAGVNASISDMARFILALLDKDASTTDHACQMIFSPQIESNLYGGYFREWDKTESIHYGIGWRLVGYKGRNISYHGGYVQGYKAEIAVCRDEDIGIVYLTNSPNSVASKSIPMFLNLFFQFRDRKKMITSIDETAPSKELS
jgi:beta-lactamase class C